ncbi:RNA-directed DNA polymerase (Reverse transcriptase) domain containing protein [Elysia marginata]|uniref:RNA-directed DNA polymerase (Reverse transcriptase) domain containing protein n=1 Tax=Elysia marginata TaxID=1093978 RepID=A0AAV4HDV8_9GAST|nr:RNA-directed DNA polymerase (Reverse transcriptase) domain containing protein [Elysia marginata]
MFSFLEARQEPPISRKCTTRYSRLTKEVPPSWNEAETIILFKKGNPGDLKNFRPTSLVAYSYKVFTCQLQKQMEIVLHENEPCYQAGFRKKFSTEDHIYNLNQVIGKTKEYNLPLCVGFIDYEKAFDSVEHFAIIEAPRKININFGKYIPPGYGTYAHRQSSPRRVP